MVLTTQADGKPVFVSVGNRIGLLPAARRVLETVGKHRLPEPIFHADAISPEAGPRGPHGGGGALRRAREGSPGTRWRRYPGTSGLREDRCDESRSP